MDFTWKKRWVLDGHKKPDPIVSTYAGVLSRESVHTAFTYEALNVIEVCAVDIRNSYLQAPSSQKDYIVCGPEFGIEKVRKYALVWPSLYGGGNDFGNHLRSFIRNLSYAYFHSDPDVWMWPEKHLNGTDYY